MGSGASLLEKNSIRTSREPGQKWLIDLVRQRQLPLCKENRCKMVVRKLLCSQNAVVSHQRYFP